MSQCLINTHVQLDPCPIRPVKVEFFYSALLVSDHLAAEGAVRAVVDVRNTTLAWQKMVERFVENILCCKDCVRFRSLESSGTASEK